MTARHCAHCSAPLPPHSGPGRPAEVCSEHCRRRRDHARDEARRDHRMAAMLTDPDGRGSSPLPPRDEGGRRWPGDYDPEAMAPISLPRREVLALGEYVEKTHADEAAAVWEARLDAARAAFRDLPSGPLVGVDVLRSVE